MLTLHVSGLELSQQSVGRDSVIKLQGAAVNADQCQAISWEEFQVIEDLISVMVDGGKL